MATLNPNTTWTIELDTKELRLVLRALGGRMSGKEEILAAKELGDELSILRATKTKQVCHEVDKLLRNLNVS